jgi:hypothetical protein
MKQLLSLIIISVFLLQSCQLNVLFDKSVPPGIDAIDQVPALFQGVYLCESDSSFIYADRFIIYQESYFEFETTLQKVKETEGCSVVDGGIYLPGRQECVPFEYISEDSITAMVYDIDTLFAFREGEVLKYYKGHLFINYMDDNQNWMTFMITPLEDGALKWDLIEVPNIEKKINDITDQVVSYEDDKKKKKYVINPSLVEFDYILEKDYTRLCDILNPVNFE